MAALDDVARIADDLKTSGAKQERCWLLTEVARCWGRGVDAALAEEAFEIALARPVEIHAVAELARQTAVLAQVAPDDGVRWVKRIFARLASQQSAARLLRRAAAAWKLPLREIFECVGEAERSALVSLVGELPVLLGRVFVDAATRHEDPRTIEALKVAGASAPKELQSILDGRLRSGAAFLANAWPALHEHLGGASPPPLDVDWRVDPLTRTLSDGLTCVTLSPAQVGLLVAFTRSPERALSHFELLEAADADTSPRDAANRCGAAIKTLRKKLQALAPTLDPHAVVKTVRGKGYCWSVNAPTVMVLGRGDS